MVNWKLIKCAFNQHEYNEPINEDLFNRVIHICKYCNYTEVLIDDYIRLQEAKARLIEFINRDSFAHAKTILDELYEKSKV